MICLAAIAGALFGFLILPLGFFIGLQVNPLLADLLLLPFIIGSWLTKTPLGEMGIILRFALALVSSSMWACIFALVALVFKKATRKN